MSSILQYRGHIRNWKNLCSELDLDAGLPRAQREPAVLLAAYEKWGREMGNHIYGMFAFALWDEKKEELFGLRDQFGTKTFYYYMTKDGRLLTGTLIEELMQEEGFEKELNEDLLQIYLSLTYTPGEDTFYKGVKKLLPGRGLVWKKGMKQPEIFRYFRPEFRPEQGKTAEEWGEELYCTLQEIMPEVKDEDERAESFLSGGVDSSFVLAVSDADCANSCGYEEERFDESKLAEETAKALGRKFSRCTVTPEDFFAAVPWVVRGMEQPLADASAIAFGLGAKATAAHTKLCYSGEGSDEMFGGYNMYRNAARYGENLPTFYVGNTNIMKEEEKQELLLHYKEGFKPIDLARDIYQENTGYDPLSKMMDVDIQFYLEGDIYLNVDKTSRAAGLEVRMPLTDVRIFNIASRIPAELRMNEEQNKLAVRMAAAKVLPEEVAFRKKLGFVVPIRVWLADERYNGDVRRLLGSELAGRFFRKDVLEGIYREYIGGNSDLWRKVWTVYIFLLWVEMNF